MAPARPCWARFTAREIASQTAAELRGSGRAGLRVARCSVARSAAFGTSPQERNTSGSPTSLRGRPLILPLSCWYAATAISGPIPAGSPIVTRTQDFVCASAVLDIGLSAQIAHIAPRKRGHLLIEELLLDLLARRHVVRLKL